MAVSHGCSYSPCTLAKVLVGKGNIRVFLTDAGEQASARDPDDDYRVFVTARNAVRQPLRGKYATGDKAGTKPDLKVTARCVSKSLADKLRGYEHARLAVSEIAGGDQQVRVLVVLHLRVVC